MEELLEKINETFDNCINNSNEETQLQLKIVKGNVNTLIQEYMGSHSNTNNITTEVEELVDPNKKRIFIVDDSSIVRNYLEKLLKEDYAIDMASDGEEAINKLKNMDPEHSYNAILLDLMMPNVDGFGVLDYLAKENITIPVVVISGDNTGPTIARAFRYNVMDMIEKPFDSKTIEEKMKRILDKE